MSKLTSKYLLVAALILAPLSSHAASISAYYGDDDGFGLGITSGALSDAQVNGNNATAGEADFTDIRLIGGPYSPTYPAFQPTGGFDAFSVSDPISSATLTIRTASFDPITPLESPNRMILDGVEVSGFFAGFPNVTNNNIFEMTFNLSASMFGLLADGNVSLAGTTITEASGSGSFQIDFLRLDIETAPVPLPAAGWLLIGGLGGLVALRRRKTKA